MPKTFITRTIDGVAAVDDGKWQDVLTEAAKHRRCKVSVESFSEDAEWSQYQCAWWKGILLPGLAEDTGDSIAYWEAVLKLAVMPDDFQFINVVVDDTEFSYLPSITTLGMKKMNVMIKGSVAHLRDERIYGDKFHWVTEPRRELRK